MRSVYLFVAAAVAIAAVSAQKDYNYNNVDYSDDVDWFQDAIEERQDQIKDRFLPDFLKKAVLTLASRYEKRWGGGGEVDFADRRIGSASEQTLFPSAILGSFGGLGVYYFVKKIDEATNRTSHAFNKLRDNVNMRIEKVEEAMGAKEKKTKKLDFKVKGLCKLAFLFNNPNYDLCNQGFDVTQIEDSQYETLVEYEGIDDEDYEDEVAAPSSVTAAEEAAAAEATTDATAAAGSEVSEAVAGTRRKRRKNGGGGKKGKGKKRRKQRLFDFYHNGGEYIEQEN